MQLYKPSVTYTNYCYVFLCSCNGSTRILISIIMLTSLRGIRCLLLYRLFVSHYLFWLAPDKSQKRNDPLLLQCFCFHVYFYDCLKDNRDRLRRSLEIKLLTNVPNHILGYLAFTDSEKHSVQTHVMLLFFFTG